MPHRTPSLDLLLKLHNSLNEIICVVDSESRFVYINQAAYRIWGYQPEELIGRNCLELLVPDDMYPTTKAVEIAQEGVPVRTFENRYLRKDGSIAIMFWSGEWNEEDQLMYCTGQDITEQKQMEEEMELLSLIAKETVNCIILTDLKGRIIWVNESFTRTTGYSFEEVIGKEPGTLLACEGKDENTKTCIDAHIAKGEPFRTEILNGRKDGSTFWWEVHYQPLLDKEGNVKMFFSVNTDITERKKLEEELQVQQRRFTAAVIAAQEHERTVVSQELHDNINQVLTTVKLYAELCLSEPSNTEKLLKKSIQLLQSSINEIRSLSKRLSAPSIGNMKLSESIGELIETVVQTGEVYINFDKDGTDELVVDHEVHLALYRIMQEHLTNILKHSKAQHVYVALDFENERLLLSVKDDGIGFNIQERRSGVGITNMITRVESLNGTIDLQSEVGKGCQLKVELPLSL